MAFYFWDIPSFGGYGRKKRAGERAYHNLEESISLTERQARETIAFQKNKNEEQLKLFSEKVGLKRTQISLLEQNINIEHKYHEDTINLKFKELLDNYTSARSSLAAQQTIRNVEGSGGVEYKTAKEYSQNKQAIDIVKSYYELNTETSKKSMELEREKVSLKEKTAGRLVGFEAESYDLKYKHLHEKNAEQLARGREQVEDYISAAKWEAIGSLITIGIGGIAGGIAGLAAGAGAGVMGSLTGFAKGFGKGALQEFASIGLEGLTGKSMPVDLSSLWGSGGDAAKGIKNIIKQKNIKNVAKKEYAMYSDLINKPAARNSTQELYGALLG